MQHDTLLNLIKHDTSLSNQGKDSIKRWYYIYLDRITSYPDTSSIMDEILSLETLNHDITDRQRESFLKYKASEIKWILDSTSQAFSLERSSNLFFRRQIEVYVLKRLNGSKYPLDTLGCVTITHFKDIPGSRQHNTNTFYAYPCDNNHFTVSTGFNHKFIVSIPQEQDKCFKLNIPPGETEEDKYIVTLIIE